MNVEIKKNHYELQYWMNWLSEEIHERAIALEIQTPPEFTKHTYQNYKAYCTATQRKGMLKKDYFKTKRQICGMKPNMEIDKEQFYKTVDFYKFILSK